MHLTHWLTGLSSRTRHSFGARRRRPARRGARLRCEFRPAEALEQRVLLSAASAPQLMVEPELSSGNFTGTVDGLTGVLEDGDEFGTSVVDLGDLDGDGIDDRAVGAPRAGDNTYGNYARGAVHVLFMNADGTVKSQQQISRTKGNLTANWDLVDKFGSSLASLGDLDGDGINDLAVGAEFDGDGGGSRGAAYILFLNADGTVKSHQKISDTEGNFTASLDDSDRFGSSLANLGDLDGDGITDLAVGAGGDDDGGSGRGAVYVLSLNADGTVKSHQKISDTDGNFTALRDDNDSFGFSLANLGDLDGDGITDLAVGARFDDDGGAGRGATYVLFLNEDGTVKSHQKISDTEGNFNAGLNDNDWFGSSLANLGDLDADGVSDLAVGAESDDDGGNRRGAAYVLFLNADGTVKSHQKISNTAGNFTASLDDGDWFGASLGSLGDLDGDGLSELAVGAPYDDAGGNNRGAVHVLFLNADGTVKSHQTISDNMSNPFDLVDTFFLNSNPDAAHTIFLDFDGHTTSGTIWNSSYTDGADIVTPAYGFEGDTSSFTDSELSAIQRIWQRVAEDFLPFDVNVTTQDPGVDALSKTHSNPRRDPEWGIRVVIGGNSHDWYGSAGGVAYRNSFNWGSDTPAFVFTEGTTTTSGSATEKRTAEVISHEAGHTLGLSHDGHGNGQGFNAYYYGHENWAPIMGVGSYREITQWSQGEYFDAYNTEDDLAIITTQNGFGYRADDHGGTLGTATPLTATVTSLAGAGIIEQNTDFDHFSFTATDNVDVELTINPAERGANLDILAELYDASNTLIAWANPVDALDALLQVSLTAGDYYLSITGTGKGDPLTDGYSDYGSLGQYFISGIISAGAPNTAPLADAGAAVSGSEDLTVTFDASGSFDADGDALTYHWDFGDGNTATTNSPTIDHTYLWGDTFDVTLTVDDGRGGTDSATTTAAIGEVNDVPVAQTSGPYSGFAGTAITLDASGSSDFDNLDGTAANDQTLTYTWDFGDGNTATGVSVSHTYAAAGDYTVTLTVSDGTDSETTTVTASISTAPTGSPNDIYVWDIAFENRSRGKGGSKHDERVQVVIRRDSDGDGTAESSDAVVAGATVTVVISGPEGGTFTGITDSAGVFTSGWLMDVPDGSYTAVVTSVSSSGLTWNPGLDVETSEQHNVPHAAASLFAVQSAHPWANGYVNGGDSDDESDDPLAPLTSAFV